MTDLVYASCHDAAWTPGRDEDETLPYPALSRNGMIPAACVPRVGDIFASDHDHTWWRVDRVVWSNYQNTIVPPEVRRVEWLVWVDITCTNVDSDPR